jgi:glycosyltransferase involved in cell wall biosynthesis
VLLEALRLLKARGRDVRLKILGAGPAMDRLQPEFERLGTAETVNAFVDYDMLIDGIQESCCVLLPYLNATQSGVLAGAYAGHRPVIASRTGGLVDVIADGDNGLLVEPGDAVALTDAMERLMTDPQLLARLTDGARRTAEGPLNWDVITDDMADCYQR